MKYPACTLANILSPGKYCVVSTDKEHVAEVKVLEENMRKEMHSDDTSECRLSCQMYVAVTDFTGQLRRGIIEKKLQHNLYQVLLIDYGRIVQIKKSYIKVITNKDFIKVEPLAFIVKLYGLIPTKNVFVEGIRKPMASKDWMSESQEFVQNFFRDGQKVIVKSFLIQQRTVYGDLFVKPKPNSKFISLRKILCRNEFCVYSESNFFRLEGLNSSCESSELKTKLEFVAKWQRENFGEVENNSYTLSSALSSLNPCTPGASCHSSNQNSQTSNGENLEPSVDQLKKFGLGRGKLKRLIEEMKNKERLSVGVQQSDAPKETESPLKPLGRGRFLKKYWENKKRAETLTTQSWESDLKTINSDWFSDEEEERKKTYDCDQAIEKFSDLPELSDSNEMTEASLSTKDLRTAVKEKEESERSSKPAEKSARPGDPETSLESSCSEENYSLRTNIQVWERSLSMLKSGSWTPYVVFDDTVVEPANTFRELPIQPSIIQNLEKGGAFRELSQVQRWAIPAIRKQHNTVIIGSAKTGKTLSYIVPLIDYVQDLTYFEELSPGNGPSVVIVASSSRVCESICFMCHSLLGNFTKYRMKKSDIKIVLAHGNGCEKEIWVDLTNGCDILISTPHCLVRLLEHPILTNFERLTCLVLDEIDVISQNPFRKNVRIILEKANFATRNRHYQSIVAGERWTPNVESLVKTYVKSRALIIGSSAEAVIFKKLKPNIHLVDRQHKSETLLNLLEDRINKFKTLVVCERVAEASRLDDFLTERKIPSLLAHEKVTADRLKGEPGGVLKPERGLIYLLKTVVPFCHFGTQKVTVNHLRWKDVPRMSRCSCNGNANDSLHTEIQETWKFCSSDLVLITTDGVLNELNIREAQTLVHFELPTKSKTNFYLRYTTLEGFLRKNDSFLKARDSDLNLQSIILVDDENHRQLPHIIDFVTRLGGKIPSKILGKCEEIRRVIEIEKSDAPICRNLLSFGRCRSSKDCHQRHALVKSSDSPTDLPTSGWVNFVILKTQDASCFYAKLVEHIDLAGNSVKMEDRRFELLEKVAEFFRSENNLRVHGAAKCGDVCAVKSNVEDEEVFYRAKIIEVLKTDKYGKPLEVNVKLLDEGDIWKRKVTELFELPTDLSNRPPTSTDVWVVGIQPMDFDVTWSEIANEFVSNLMTQKLNGNQYWSGKIVLALNNTLFLDPIKRKEFLPLLKTHVFDLVVQGELLNKRIAVANNEHLPALLKLCATGDIDVPKKEERKKEDPSVVQPQWAFFDLDFIRVTFLAAESTSTVFLQPKKFEKVLQELEEDCQKEAAEAKSSKAKKSKPGPVTVGMFCLALFEDGKWNRGRIESENETQFHVFFVDHGDFLFVRKADVIPISQTLLLRLPCQAVECSLVGIRPEEECPVDVLREIYSFSEDGKEDLYAYIVEKDLEPSTTSGRKYKVNLLNRKGISLNKMLVDKEMVRVEESERVHFEDVEMCGSDDVDDDDDDDIDEEKDEEEEEEDDTTGEKELWKSHFNNLADDMFENEEALEFLKEFASKFLPTSIPSQAATPREETCPPAEKTQIAPKVQNETQKETDSELKLKTKENVLTPQVLWCQNQLEVQIKIVLGNVEDYNLECTINNVSFRCFVKEKFYAVDFKLFGAINPQMTKLTIKAFHVVLVLTKLAFPLWPRLHADKGKHGWINLDVESLVDKKGVFSDKIESAKLAIESGMTKKGIRSENIKAYSDSEEDEVNADEFEDNPDFD